MFSFAVSTTLYMMALSLASRGVSEKIQFFLPITNGLMEITKKVKCNLSKDMEFLTKMHNCVI
ncbi:hypothetical protein DJ94_807 [Bacillus pseudomycoides]|nr:hypothetical protein DJ94_807 [Bacillus pseudomycoides]